MPRIFISDSVTGGTHGATIKAAVLANHSGLVDADITLQLNGSYSVGNILLDMATAITSGYEAFITATSLSSQLTPQTEIYYASVPATRVFCPLGSNSYERIIYSPDALGSMITCGASNATANETAYGNALWFFDNDNDAVATDYSSFSTGVICGKLLYIKDERGGTWGDALYAAKITASGAGLWNIYNGYGIINVASAISYSESTIESVQSKNICEVDVLRGYKSPNGYIDFNTPH